MTKLDLFVYQNYVDLHSISAFEAVTRYLGQSKCVSLKRFVHWIIEYKENISKQECFEKLTRSSYLLYNPNKEGISVDTVPAIKDKYQHVILDVSSSLGVKQEEIRLQLETISGLTIQSLRKHITWDCAIDTSSYQDAKLYVENSLTGVADSEGFLVNQIYERFSWPRRKRH